MKKKTKSLFMINTAFLTLFLSFFININTQQVMAQAVDTDWPQVQHDAQHSGYISDTYGPPYTTLWTFDRKDVSPAPPISTRVQPVVAFNLVYLPSNDGKLYAIKTSNGSIAWSTAAQGPLVNSAAVDTKNSIVVVGSLDHNVYGINATTGAKVWSFTTSGMIRIAPVIAEDRVFIGDTKGTLYALNPTNGQQIWMTQLDSTLLETPAYYKGNVYVGTFSSRAYGIKGQDGQILWQKQLNGQGMRDRWVTAGNGSVIFTPVPQYGGNSLQQSGTDLLNAVSAPDWSTQRQDIIDNFTANPAQRAVYVFDAMTGAEIDPPILYTSGGSTSEHGQPVVLPTGKFNTMYRYTEGIPNPGCGATCIIWSVYLGEYDPSANDITNLDTWGTGTSPDTTKKVFSHTDESTGLMRSGSIVYLSTTRGIFGFDTISRTTIPFVVFDTSIGGFFAASPIVNSSGDDGPPTAAETDSDGNDFVRPVVIADGVFYVLNNSTLQAIKGTRR